MISRLAIVKAVIITVSLLPVPIYAWYLNDIDNPLANPLETVTRVSGYWAILFLFVTLSITPLRRVTGYAPLVRFRRLFGLMSFFYVCLHLFIFCFLDVYFNADQTFASLVKYISGEIVKRPYLLVGFFAFLLMIPLAITSTRGWQRRLGSRWKTLHKLVFVIAILAVVHFIWLVKQDVRDPVFYIELLVILLGARGYVAWKKRRAARAVA